MRPTICLSALLSLAALAGASPIAVYDLTPTLARDLADPRQVRAVWDECHAVAALQGIVNRRAARLYLRYVVSAHGRGNVDDYWLAWLRRPGAWLADRPLEPVASVEGLVTRFRRDLAGVVLYDPNVAATSNLASTLAGVEDLLPIRYDPRPGSLYDRLVRHGPRLPVLRRLVRGDGTPLFTGRGRIPGTKLASTGSAKCDTYLWLKTQVLDRGLCDGAYGAYYLDQFWQQTPRAAVANHHCLTNHDFFISRRAFFFDLSPWGDEIPIDDPHQAPGTDRATLEALLLSAYAHGGRERMIHIGGFVPWANKYTAFGAAGGRHEPVASEWEYGKVISAYNGFMDADAIGYGAMANASFFQHYPLRDHYPQATVTPADLRARGYLTDDGRVRVAGREFLVFYVGDYDCAAWLYQRIPDLWDDPARGTVPMMWCFSPVLERRAPMTLDYVRQTATARDRFAAADNGAGYCEPGMLQEPRGLSGLPSGLTAWARHNRPLYERWDLSITGFIIYAHGPELNRAGLDCYASFSPAGIVTQRGPTAFLHGRMPVLRSDHDINEGDPHAAARHVVARVAARREGDAPPFHWFRNILKSPAWYRDLARDVTRLDPRIELLDGPSFFALLRVYLANHPAAQGSP